MQKILLLCTLFFSSVIIHASNFEFVVWTKSGEQITYKLNTKPKITNAIDALILSTTESVIEYPKSHISKFTLKSGFSNIDCNIKSDVITQFQNHILLTNLQPGATVRVSDFNGRILFCQIVYESEAFEIPISEFPKGIYIISVNTLTYKFIKK